MKTKDITLNAIMVAVLIVSSQLSVPIGPIPITLQTLAILLIGYLLTPRNALFATFIYLITGLIGLPVFAGFSGGFQAVLLPSFGFILAFIPATYFQAKYLQKIQTNDVKDLVIAGAINILITYALGLPYMAIILNIYMNSQLNISAILMAGMLPFVPGDLLKLAVSIVMARRLHPILQKRYASI